MSDKNRFDEAFPQDKQNGIEDLEKIKHYCDLEIEKIKNAKKKK